MMTLVMRGVISGLAGGTHVAGTGLSTPGASRTHQALGPQLSTTQLYLINSTICIYLAEKDLID